MTKVILVVYNGDESRGVCGIASDIEHAHMLVGQIAREGNVYGGQFAYYMVEIDKDYPKFPWEVAGTSLEDDKQ